MSGLVRRPRHAGVIVWVVGVLMAGATVTVLAQTHDDGTTTEPDNGPPPTKQHSPLLLDIEAYYTSPLHWDVRDWD